MQAVKRKDTIGVFDVVGYDSDHVRITTAGGEFGVFIHNILRYRCKSIDDALAWLSEFMGVH